MGKFLETPKKKHGALLWGKPRLLELVGTYLIARIDIGQITPRCSKAEKSGEGLTSRTQDSFPAVAASEINGWPSKGVLFMFAEAVEPYFLDNTIPAPTIYILYTLKNYHNYDNLSCVQTLACSLLAWNRGICYKVGPRLLVYNPTLNSLMHLP